jgi:F420-0:gamma-glutamyl ligase
MGVSTSVDAAFVRLLGDVDCARETLGRVAPPTRSPLRWQPLPRVAELPGADEQVRVAEDWEQPPPLRLQLRFQPDPEGIYDVQWLAVRGPVAAGEPFARCYRTSDGMMIEQCAPFALRIEELHVERNRRVVRGDLLCTAAVPQLALDLGPIEALVAARMLTLAQSANAVVKGIMGALGESGQVTEAVHPVTVALAPEHGYDALLGQVADALAPPVLRDGDVVVVSEKVLAIAQGRTFPLELLYANDPKATDREGREELAAAVREHVPGVTPEDLLCADVLEREQRATAGVADPNAVAHELAQLLHERHGVRCDVVISDTDTGLDVAETLIGVPTLGATPLGATGGLVLYECMRVANAAEFVRGSHRGIPLVVCRPHARRLRREGIGEPRGYPGRLDAARERRLGYA